MVRGPAALLIALAGAALLWVAPVLPTVQGGRGDAAILVAGGAGLLAVVACAVVPVPAVETRSALWLALPASVLLAVALDAAGVGSAATPAEALAYGTAGTAFAAVLDTRSLVLALPLFVGVVDVVNVAGGAAGGLQLDRLATEADPLSLALPAWGSDATVARLSGVDVLFLAAFAAYAQRFGLRPRATVVAMTTALAAALVLVVALGRGIPVLALLAAAFLVVNADRLPALYGRARRA